MKPTHLLPDGRRLRLTIATGNAAFGDTAGDRAAEVGMFVNLKRKKGPEK